MGQPLNLSLLRPAMPWPLLPLRSSFPLTAQASVLFIAWRYSFLTLFCRVVLAHASNCKWSIKHEAVLKAKRETLYAKKTYGFRCLFGPDTRFGKFRRLLSVRSTIGSQHFDPHTRQLKDSGPSLLSHVGEAKAAVSDLLHANGVSSTSTRAYLDFACILQVA